MALSQLSFLLFLFTIINLAKSNEQQEYSFLQSQTPVHRPMRLMLSHFKLYWHDVVSGPNPTSIPVTQGMTNTSVGSIGFGDVYMIDDALTVGPEPTSKLVGRAQGFYALASATDFSLLMSMNFAFMVGKYNGSTIAITGRNPVHNEVREMSIVGGSGLFRLARGYVQLSLNFKTDAVVEYNVFVEHY